MSKKITKKTRLIMYAVLALISGFVSGTLGKGDAQSARSNSLINTAQADTAGVHDWGGDPGPCPGGGPGGGCCM